MGSVVWSTTTSNPDYGLLVTPAQVASCPGPAADSGTKSFLYIIGICTTRELVAPYLFYRPVTALLIIYLWDCFPWPLRSWAPPSDQFAPPNTRNRF